MLGKLLKYEMKASARTLLPLYIGTLVVAMICGIQLVIMNNGINGQSIWWISFGGHEGYDWFIMFMFLLFFGLCVAIVMLTIMVVVQRFNKSLIGDEGYLMFTLPVTHVQLLNSKLIASLLWVLIGSLVMCLSGVIVMLPSLLSNLDANEWLYLWNELLRMLDNWNPAPYIFSTTLNGLFSIMSFILLIYLSIMVGQTEQFNKHRTAIAVVLFFLFNWLFGLIETTILHVLGFNFYQSTITAITFLDFSHAYNNLMWSDIVFTAVQCTACFVGIVWMMKKKLNL